MIPPSHFLNVIQAERAHDLERWQRTRDAKAAASARARGHRWPQLRAALGMRHWFGRSMPSVGACDEGAASPACC